MARDHFLMYALCGVVIINVIAIILLNNHLAAKERPAPEIIAPPEIVRTQPVVQTLLISDQARCPDCFDIGMYAQALNDTILMEIEHVTAGGERFSDILPAIAFNQTLEQYPMLIDGWEVAGLTVNIPDGRYAGTWYVLPSQNAPYYSEGKVHGRVTVTYLTFDSCTECYDVLLNREFLNTSRIVPYKEIIIDAQSPQGEALVARYNITALPTLLMDREAGAYTNLQPGWDVVGTIEQDGTYVLRELQRLGVPYYDVGRKKLMKP